jgi:hypothetical protein
VSMRAGARLGWALWTVTVALLGGYLALYAAHYARAQLYTWLDVVEDVLGAVVLLAFATLGALIVWRQPGNRVGWLFGAIGLLWVVERFAGVYANYVLIAEPGALPGGLAAAWLQNWTWMVFAGCTTCSCRCCFPTAGSCRRAGDRWRGLAPRR